MLNVDTLLEQTPALPSLPEVAHRILQEIDQESVTVSQVENLLAADQVLSAKVLRLANSSYYGMTRKVSSLGEAINILGFSAIRNIVVSAGMLNNFNGECLKERALWRYSLHTAVTAKYLAKQVNVDSELAFTVGIIHGIGILVMNTGMPALMPMINDGIPPYPSQNRLKREREKLGFSYADVGAALVRKWNFPEQLAIAITGAAEPARYPIPLHAIIFVASWIADAHESKIRLDELAHEWPEEIAAIAHCTTQKIADMPALHELCAGLEELVSFSETGDRK